MLSNILNWNCKRKIQQHNPDVEFLKVESRNISGLEKFKIGNGCRIGPGCMINAAGGLTIGHNVILAPNIVIWTQNHRFKNASMLPYDSGVINKPVIIGNNCWLGEGVKIAPGVVVGEGVILAMGSVVFDDIPDFSIVAGNPALVIATRKDIEHYRDLDTQADSYLINKIKG